MLASRASTWPLNGFCRGHDRAVWAEASDVSRPSWDGRD